MSTQNPKSIEDFRMRFNSLYMGKRINSAIDEIQIEIDKKAQKERIKKMVTDIPKYPKDTNTSSRMGLTVLIRNHSFLGIQFCTAHKGLSIWPMKVYLKRNAKSLEETLMATVTSDEKKITNSWFKYDRNSRTLKPFPSDK